MRLKIFPEIIENSLYYKYLSRYYSAFKRSQITVLYFDELVSNYVEYSKKLCSALGITYREVQNKIIRGAEKPRSHLLSRVIKIGAVSVRKMGFPSVVGFIKHSSFSNIFYKKYLSQDKPKLSLVDRERLKEYFVADVKKLSILVDDDLVSRWFIDEPGGNNEK